MKNIKFLLPVSVLGVILGYILSNSYQFSICIQNDVLCHFSYERTGGGLFYGMGALALIFLVLLVTPRAFPAWKKFAVWFVPVAAILFAVYPQPGAWDFLSPDPISVFKWVSAFYVLVSLSIIALSFRSSK